MNRFSLLIALFAAAPLLAEDAAPVSPAAPDPSPSTEKSVDTGAPLEIGMAPREALNRHSDLFRRVADGKKDALKDWQALKPAERVATLSHALAYGNGALRGKALDAAGDLSADDDPAGKLLPAMLKAALKDDDEAFRQWAEKAVVDNRHPLTPKLLAHAAAGKDPVVRQRANRALKAMGAPRVFEVVIEHWRESWGAGARAHMFVARQQSYVADYEISGDSYDPVIRQFLAGVVLDVKPLLAHADIYIVRTLREVTGQHFGNDRGVWEQWWKGEKQRLAAAADDDKDAAAVPADPLKREVKIIRGKSIE